MTIDVIIPNYNGSGLVKKNLPQVLTQVKKYNANIIIADDHSKFEDFEELSKFIKELQDKREKVVLQRNEKNLGFSSTVNKGVAASKADFIVLLNTDVYPEKDFLDAALADFIQDENLFGVGLMDKSIEDNDTVLRGRGLASWQKGFLLHKRGEVDKTDTFWVSGGSSVIRRELFVKLGGLDTLYDPFYWEDIDLSYRAKKSGYELKFEFKSVVEHRHEEGAIKKYYSSSKVKTIAYRNQFIFVWKNISDPSLILSHLVWFPYHVVSAFLRLDAPFILGFICAIVRLPLIINKRYIQAKFYKKRDRDLFNNQ